MGNSTTKAMVISRTKTITMAIMRRDSMKKEMMQKNSRDSINLTTRVMVRTKDSTIINNGILTAARVCVHVAAVVCFAYVLLA
mgnify:CR=1 FL=1